MAVYPDGEALSERERRILEQIERDIETNCYELLDVLPVQGYFRPFQLWALYLLVAEVALALATYVSMTALTTFGSTAWSVAGERARASTPQV
jgi:hypothetical protein